MKMDPGHPPEEEVAWRKMKFPTKTPSAPKKTVTWATTADTIGQELDTIQKIPIRWTPEMTARFHETAKEIRLAGRKRTREEMEAADGLLRIGCESDALEAAIGLLQLGR